MCDISMMGVGECCDAESESEVRVRAKYVCEIEE